MISIHPTSGEKIKEYKTFSNVEVSSILDDVNIAYHSWRKTNYDNRAQYLNHLAKVLRNNFVELAKLITLEMGKPIAESKSEIEKCAWVCEFYAENGESFLQDEHIQTDFTQSFISFEPIGTVLAVMPWNFPFWQVFRFLAPNLMVGNTAVLKHASNVSSCALKIEEIVKEAGIPQNVFRTLLIDSSQVELVIQHSNIQAVTLTGSESAGSSVASIAGREIKKTVLELGGADPFIILDDANIKDCVNTAISARFLNTGQSCIAAKRFIVLESILDKFIELVLEKMKLLKVGDPFEETTHIGPLAKQVFVDEINEQVQQSISMGAHLLFGGKSIDGRGFFYEPTLLTNCNQDMPVMNEETFGPVLSIISANSEEEAIKIANNSELGLGGCVWTQNIKKGIQLARQIETGAVFINDMTKSDPRLPFGGIKKSGYGRELSREGIREFTNVKTIVVKE